MTRRPVLSIVAMIGALLAAGCQSARFHEPAVITSDVVDGSLDALPGQPVLTFTGTIDDFDGAGNAATVALDVVRNGVVYGTAELADAEVGVMAVDGAYFVSADKDYWVDRDVSGGVAKKLAGGWTPVDPDDWFDAGSLLTAEPYTQALNRAVGDAVALDAWLSDPVDVDGVSAYPVPVGEGAVYATVAEPHTIVKVENVTVALGEGDDGTTVTLSVDTVGADHVEGLFDDLRDAVDDLSTVYSSGGVTMHVSSDFFSCGIGECYFFASFDTSGLADYQIVAEEVTVSFTGTADAGSAGTEKCTGKETVTVGESATAQCTVTFNLSGSGSVEVKPTWETNGLATFRPDTDAIKDDLTSLQDEIQI